jgi:hypothetical protein
MGIREIQSDTNQLLEQGRVAESMLKSAERDQTIVVQRLEYAYAKLRAAAQLDEDGNYQGDVVMAIQVLDSAQIDLNTALDHVRTAQDEVLRVNGLKHTEVEKIERYNKSEGKNLDVYQQLAGLKFGNDIRKQIGGLLNRMNSADDAKIKLEQSLGQNSAKPVFYSGIGGGSNASRRSVDAIEMTIPNKPSVDTPGSYAPKGIPEGFIMFPVSAIEDPQGMSSDADFSKGFSPDDLLWGMHALNATILPMLSSGGTGTGTEDLLTNQDMDQGRCGCRSLSDTYSGYFGDTAIKLDGVDDGKFMISNGRHRVWLAKKNGITHLPVRIT